MAKSLIGGDNNIAEFNNVSERELIDIKLAQTIGASSYSVKWGTPLIISNLSIAGGATAAFDVMFNFPKMANPLAKLGATMSFTGQMCILEIQPTNEFANSYSRSWMVTVDNYDSNTAVVNLSLYPKSFTEGTYA